MRITFLGTGTSCGVPFIGCHCAVCESKDSRDKRLRTSLLVEDGDTNILLDCGPDFREQMLRCGFEGELSGLFISHEHYDHVGGIDDLRPFSHRRDVVLYADSYAAHHLRQRLPYCLVDNHYPGIPRLVLREMESHETVCCGSLSVTAIRVMHGQLPILGFRVGKMCYITDMTEIAESEFDLFEGIELLVINALRATPHPTHQTLQQALGFRQRLGLERVPTYFVHMSHDIGLHAAVDATLPAHCHLAYDGLVVELG
ncbi:MAG: MBL fold metallo-hydrolase [Bacteroidaceae bacterium]|nr:MBL fold metallo-hydrolase [Bacteroidaceae bacterium]